MRMVTAKLKARIAADGTDFIFESVPLGREYTIDLDSIEQRGWGNNGRITTRETVSVVSHNGQYAGSIPTELLEFDRLLN